MSGTSDGQQTPLFFNPEDIGHSLEEVSVDVIQTESQKVTSRWLHSAKEADLFIWFDEKQNIIKQQMSFCGQVVEWNILEGVKTGVILEEEEQPGVDASEMIRFDESPQNTSIGQAIEVLRHVLALTEEDRQLLLENFKKAPVADHLPPEEFLRLYGPSKDNKTSSPWWVKVLHWLQGKK